MVWGSAANPAVLAAQRGQMAAQCHTSNSLSGLAVPQLRLTLWCSRLCALSPHVLQKACCLVYIIVLLHKKNSNDHIQTWPRDLYSCEKTMTWSFYGTILTRETNEMSAGLDYYGRLKKKMLLEKHCRKPKLDADEGLSSRRGWEGSFLPSPSSGVKGNGDCTLHIARTSC